MKNSTLPSPFNHTERADISFAKSIPGFGSFYLRPLRIEEDIFNIHKWVNLDYAKFWGMQNTTLEQVKTSYIQICGHSQVLIGFFNDNPSFLMEMYDVLNDPLKEHYEFSIGDYGMHILVAPADRPISNFTWNVFKVVMDFMFTDERVKRVVVEPDIWNEKIHVLNKRAGFEYQKIIKLPQKTAHLAHCSREQYQMALLQERL